MGQILLSKCLVTTEADWEPVLLKEEYITLAVEKGTYQEEQSKLRNLKNRAINKDPEANLRNTILSKYAEYAVRQHFGDEARVTNPGEFHDWPDVGQVNVRFIGDPEDGLMIQDGDQGELPMVLCTLKDKTFKDKTIWLIGWGMTDQLRRTVYLINRFNQNKDWGMIGNMVPHEQFVYPRSMLYPMRTLSKEFVNTPYISGAKK
jgi:hypothetical protein